MIWRRQKPGAHSERLSSERLPSERLEDVRQEIWQAVKVSEEEVAAAADSPDLYGRLQSRIAAERRERRAVAQPPLSIIPAWLGAGGSRRWTLVAAAALLLLAATSYRWLLKPVPAPPPAVQLVPTATPPRQDSQPATPRPVVPKMSGEVAQQATSPQPRHVARRHLRVDRPAEEVATDFLPLTYLADAPAPESGHLVRVKVPRSALASFGVPMNAERAGEMVQADVVIGDDGLARAIRFIQ